MPVAPVGSSPPAAAPEATQSTQSSEDSPEMKAAIDEFLQTQAFKIVMKTQKTFTDWRMKRKAVDEDDVEPD